MTDVPETRSPFAAGAPAVPRIAPVRWFTGRVVEVRAETARARTLRFALDAPMDHLAGQHVVVRLTAPDGYRAQRAYSIASPPADGVGGSREIEITVERLDGGEVSTFLHDGLRVDDEVALRGPIGGWFAWRGDKPAFLVGGGSGVVPLAAMLRLARRLDREDLLRLVVSVRSPDELYYRDELTGPAVTVIATRTAPVGSPRPPGRLTGPDLDAAGARAVADAGGGAYVCGSSGFADHVTALLEAAGFPPAAIRVERFGPT